MFKLNQKKIGAIYSLTFTSQVYLTLSPQICPCREDSDNYSSMYSHIEQYNIICLSS